MTGRGSASSEAVAVEAGNVLSSTPVLMSRSVVGRADRQQCRRAVETFFGTLIVVVPFGELHPWRRAVGKRYTSVP